MVRPPVSSQSVARGGGRWGWRGPRLTGGSVGRVGADPLRRHVRPAADPHQGQDRGVDIGKSGGGAGSEERLADQKDEYSAGYERPGQELDLLQGNPTVI